MNIINDKLNHKSLYRLPWSLPDNGISWLEPTSVCNLHCDGCYRKNLPGSHKPFQDIKKELDVFEKLRKSDCISIAGGEPLIYPNITDLVAEIYARGFKPIINSNGVSLTKELLIELKKVGVFGFTFHVDSRQNRGAAWQGKNEVELNQLRLQYAQLLAEVGGIVCSFNLTVYEENLKYAPELIQWAQGHIDIVHTMVFICFRHVVPDMPFDWYIGGQKINWQEIWYHSEKKRAIEIKSTDVLRITREKIPEFTPAAYLNGTAQADAFKWMLTERIGNKKRIYGYAGAKFLELVMISYHFFKNRYLAYLSPKSNQRGKPALFFLWPFDKGIKKALIIYLKALIVNPFLIFKKVYMQTIMFIQPVDFMENGDQSMCDSCPDITVHEGKLVWSCRLEELKHFGMFLKSVPKEN